MKTQFDHEVDEFRKTGKKLNEWTEEEKEVPVISPVLNEKTGKVSFKTSTKKVKEKTMYVAAPSQMVTCSKHFFLPENPKKYIFKCKNCGFHYQARVPIHKYKPDTGEIVVRLTGRVVA